MAAARQAAQFLPTPGGKEHLDQQNHRHADKHQLPVARHFILVGVYHQFPHHRVEVQVETGKDLAIDKQQSHARCRQNG